MKKILVEAPASSANLGPGFDVFAIALGEPRDRIELRTEKAGRLSVELAQVEGSAVPMKAEENGIGVVTLAVARKFGVRARIRVKIWKSVPIGVGLGSSGASAAAAVFAMNAAHALNMSRDELIYYAGKGEEVTSGAAHYDNVSASLLGGFVIVRDTERRPTAVVLDPPERMAICVATPTVNLPARKTAYARSLLPKTVQLKDLVKNIAAASTIVAGFARGDIEMVGQGMNDEIVEPARKAMVPGYDRVKTRAAEAGATGVCISGAGPSMLSIVDGKARAKPVLEAMLSAFRDSGVEADGFVTRPGVGAKAIEIG